MFSPSLGNDQLLIQREDFNRQAMTPCGHTKVGLAKAIQNVGGKIAASHEELDGDFSVG
ncbi:MAG: hypothetical protein ACI97A_004252 [Planctomycetota bacterium]|jgi:hypothetical protein